MKKALLDLLYAAFNIGGNAEPDTDEGERCSEAAMEALEVMGRLADAGGSEREGALLAAKLFVEVLSAPDPVEYMRQETAKGLAGTRHEFEGAGQ